MPPSQGTARPFTASVRRSRPSRNAAGADFPQPLGLFAIKDLGGWSDVNKRFFDKEAGIVADIERTVGVSVGS